MNIFLFVVAILAIAGVIYVWARQATLRREAYIRQFELPRGLFAKLREQHPALTPKDCQLVAQGLRQFFLAYLQGGGKFVSMPSQVVDTLWHEFILDTRAYGQFCKKAFGQFLHHSPAATLGSAARSNEGLRRVWWHACRQENINPRNASRLPLLFALDSKLNIANGFHYKADCSGLRKQQGDGTDGAVIYCGGDFSDSSVGGSTDGFGDGGSFFGSGDGGGDSGGGDGGGCSSGCGGGGCSS